MSTPDPAVTTTLMSYLPVLIFMVIGVVIGCLPLLGTRLLIKQKPNQEKNSPYECGFSPFEDTRRPFDVRYYLVAILFIIFDLETTFMFPWGVVLRQIGWLGFGAMMLFLLILMVGFVYEWRRGALEWE